MLHKSGHNLQNQSATLARSMKAVRPRVILLEELSAALFHSIPCLYCPYLTILYCSHPSLLRSRSQPCNAYVTWMFHRWKATTGKARGRGILRYTGQKAPLPLVRAQGAGMGYGCSVSTYLLPLPTIDNHYYNAPVNNIGQAVNANLGMNNGMSCTLVPSPSCLLTA